jgi:flagellar hook-associated protein 3 FlgL
MPNRVPDLILRNTALFNMGFTASRVARLNAQISSGRRLLSPADDAVAYARAKDLRGVLAATAQYQDNIARVDERLSVAESSLASMENLLNRAKEVALEQANPTYSAEQRAVIAQEAQQLLDELVVLGNTQVDGQYIFSGYATDTPSFDATGVYGGDTGVRSIEVGEGVQVAENLTGDQFLGGSGGGVDAFALLAALRDALTANDVAGIEAAIDPLSTAIDQVTRARMTTGFRLTSLESQRGTLEEVDFQTRQLLSNAEDTDMTSAVSELVQQQNTLDVARSALARILNSNGVMNLIG